MILKSSLDATSNLELKLQWTTTPGTTDDFSVKYYQFPK